MEKIPEKLVKECRNRLQERKADLLNQAKFNRQEFQASGKTASGDEVDQSMNILAEHTMLVKQDRVRNQIYEIELALGRIERGSFGICEETDEIIEADRLMAIPWTRLSIEGAEIREELDRRFAR